MRGGSSASSEESLGWGVDAFDVDVDEMVSIVLARARKNCGGGGGGLGLRLSKCFGKKGRNQIA